MHLWKEIKPLPFATQFITCHVQLYNEPEFYFFCKLLTHVVHLSFISFQKATTYWLSATKTLIFKPHHKICTLCSPSVLTLWQPSSHLSEFLLASPFSFWFPCFFSMSLALLLFDSASPSVHQNKVLYAKVTATFRSLLSGIPHVWYGIALWRF